MDARLLWLALGGFAGGYESFLIGSLLPPISADMGVTIGEAGYVAFAYALTYAIGTPVLATAFGHVDRRMLLICAELTFACGAIMMVFAPSLSVVIAARVVLALGAGTFTATAIATAVAMSPPERRGRSIALVASGQSLAVLLGVPIGAYVVATYGWRVAYVTIAVIALMAATGLVLRLPRGILGDRVAIRERLSVVTLPGIPSALLTTLLFMLPAYMPIIFIAPLAAYAAGLGLDMLPLALLANGIGAVTGTQFGGRIADRLGARRAVMLALVAQIVLLLILAAAGLLPNAVGLPVFLFTMLAAGFVGWGFWPSQSSLIAGLVPGSPALALSLNLTALNIGVALAARIGGVIVDQSNAAWLAAAGIPFALAALAVARFAIPARKAAA